MIAGGLVLHNEAREQPSNFRDGERDQIRLPFFVKPLVACASINSVMCRCQATQLRTSSSSSPVSCLACSKHSSNAQRLPAIRTRVFSGVRFGTCEIRTGDD